MFTIVIQQHYVPQTNGTYPQTMGYAPPPMAAYAPAQQGAGIYAPQAYPAQAYGAPQGGYPAQAYAPAPQQGGAPPSYASQPTN